MDSQEQIQYLHTLSQILRSCLDELKEENKKLKEENGNQKQIIEIQQNLKKESEARQARDDTRSHLHGLTKENERLKKENERLKRVIDIMDGVIKMGT